MNEIKDIKTALDRKDPTEALRIITKLLNEFYGVRDRVVEVEVPNKENAKIIKNLELTIKELETNIERQNIEIRDKADANANLINESAEKLTENKQLKSALEALKKETADAIKEAGKLQQNVITELEKDNEAISKRLGKESKELDKLKKENEKLKAQVKALTELEATITNVATTPEEPDEEQQEEE